MRGDPGLRWAVLAFEAAQRDRVAVGEQLRALLHGRMGGAITPAEPTAPCHAAPLLARGVSSAGGADEGSDATAVGSGPTSAGMLRRILRGTAASPVPALDALYRDLADEESAMLAAMTARVLEQSVWPWVAQVRGVGASLAARLVARLDVERAATPSAFWAFCGLHTEPASRFVCDVCGAVVQLGTGFGPATARVRAHRPPLRGAPLCRGVLLPGPPLAARQAARGGPGTDRQFSRGARLVCHLIGVSLLRRGTHYKRAYDDERARLRGSRPTWSAGRAHLAALRRMEKLFLTHLWMVWRTREGLPVGTPHPAAHPAASDPWSMVGR